MYDRLQTWLDAQFPGMGLRPAYLTCLATLSMCVYWLYGRNRYAPDWFVDGLRDLTGISSANFHRYFWAHLACFVIMMLVPLVVTWFTDRMTPRELGLGIKGAGREFVIVTVLYLLFVPVIYVVSQGAGFQATYPRLALSKSDPTIFALFHLAYLLKWTAWEFFFRGFMLFGFMRDMAGRAVLVSTIPFTLMHYGKPDLEMLSALAAGFILCWLAMKGRSIWPGVLLHWAVALTMELFATRWFWALWG